MNNIEFKDTLVNVVKAMGEELIERAEDLVGNADGMNDIDIYIRIPIDGYRFDGTPTIELSRSHLSKRAIDALMTSFDRPR